MQFDNTTYKEQYVFKCLLIGMRHYAGYWVVNFM